MTKAYNATTIEHIAEMVKLSKKLAEAEDLQMLVYLLKMAEQEISESRYKWKLKKAVS